MATLLDLGADVELPLSTSALGLCRSVAEHVAVGLCPLTTAHTAALLGPRGAGSAWRRAAAQRSTHGSTGGRGCSKPSRPSGCVQRVTASGAPAREGAHVAEG